ncbi:MAG: hypothetical protein GY862_13320 [Gammaproteobacteria bacterium]|nr:hypothetical protein [Gammaproteobacteria bacterium]
MTEDKYSPSNIGSLDNQLRTAEARLQEEESLAAAADSNNLPDVHDSMAAGAATGGNVDKIRDILFGGHIRDYEKRFRRMEEHFSQESAHLRDDLMQRIKSLEDLITSETDALSEKLKADRQERLRAQQDIVQDINILKNELNNRFTQMDDQFVKEIKQMRQQTHNRFQELSMQLRQQNDNLTALVKQEVAQLQGEKVNRSDLASFFTEFAFRLNKDFAPDPGEQEQ